MRYCSNLLFPFSIIDEMVILLTMFCLSLKVEEAKLITQLAEIDAINYGLFKQAYSASVDVSKVLDQYEMSKLLKGPYDIEGACVVIKSGPEGQCEV